MKVYEHRINTRLALESVNPMHGVEIDIRTYAGSLILAHDPFVEGELLVNWLQAWKGQPLILNVKEDALESKILELLSNYSVKDFFFLDQSYPSIRRMVRQGMTKVATRVSDFEDLTTSLSSGSEWVWLDSFSGDWSYLPEVVPRISNNNQKTCLVSPELQRAESSDELRGLQRILELNDLNVTAVCTKNPDKWDS
jgi:hypothetical protein